MKVNWELHKNQKTSMEEKLSHAMQRQPETIVLLFCWTLKFCTLHDSQISVLLCCSIHNPMIAMVTLVVVVVAVLV